ncbi:MAG: hypothetical protein QOF01_2600 [Thermomicrobiales bacterium]|jgi:uncharacterized Ntn-hydrolase superfamily protein|nr:hypothetical protein [Thermomicrobiales bacterium]
MFGVVVSSSSPAVAARCAHARAGVGAVTTQNVTDPRLGPQLLDAMQGGASAAEAMRSVVVGAEHADFRQLTAVDALGGTASYSGERTLGTYRAVEGEGAVAAGNLLASPDVPVAIIGGFMAREQDDLGDRLIYALGMALAAGGEEGPVHSAGLVLVDQVPWYVADLRVDWSDDPIGELARLWELWKPQMNDYVTRALNPTAAPSYGVPGDPGSS